MANWAPEDGAKEPVTNPSETQISTEDPTIKPNAPPPAVPCLIPSFADAVKLLNSRYSCLVLDTHRRHIALPPVHMRKKRTGIQEELNAELLKYSSRLKGVPVAYDDIKIIGQYGDIYDDQGYIHINIEAMFVIFKPNKHSKLVGVINKIGIGHVGCLVHGCFNASVVKPSLLTPEQWRDSGLQVGDSLEFEVYQLDSDAAGVLLIRGRLEKSRVQELVAQTEQTEATTELENIEDSTDSQKPKKKKKRDKEKQASVEDSMGESSLSQTCENYEPDLDTAEVDSSSTGQRKKKKKKKDKSEKQASVEDSMEDSSLSQTCGNHEPDLEEVQVDSNSNGQHKKKKKDKRKESETLPSDLPASDSSEYVSEKASRKRQAAEIEGESETLVFKKKKKRQ